jgi:hypothetical protein
MARAIWAERRAHIARTPRRGGFSCGHLLESNLQFQNAKLTRRCICGENGNARVTRRFFDASRAATAGNLLSGAEL